MDDTETKELLRRNLELSQANNALLRSMRRSARWATFFRLIYWFVILGGLAVSYYYLQPYLESVLRAYQDVQNSLRGIKSQQQPLPDLRGFINGLQQPH